MKIFYLSLSSILFILAFSPFDYKVLIFISLIILFHAIDDLSKKNKIKSILFFSILFHIIGISWVSESLIDYGSLGYILSYIVTFMLAIAVSLPYLLIALFHQSVTKNGLINIFFIASIFILVEYIKSFLYGGFPWLLVGYSQNDTPFDYIYPLFGNYAVGYLVVLFSLLFYKTLNQRSLVYSSISILVLLTYLVLPVNYKNNENYEHSISYTLYQPNIYPDQVYNHNYHSKIVKKYINILEKNKSSNLIIFPETILPIPYNETHELYKIFNKHTNDKNFIISGLFTEFENKYFNSMVFFSDNVDFYSKRKLVPFGEYTPWYSSFLKLSKIINIPLSNLSHGSDFKSVFTLKDVNIIPIICFESTFPNLINSNSSNEIIVNISNDGWFGNSLAPFQHLQIAQIRSLEFNRFTLRVTNTGISAVIDNYGRVNDHIENNKEGTMNGNIPINFKRSLYSEYGDIFILMLIFFSLLMRVSIDWHKYDE